MQQQFVKYHGGDAGVISLTPDDKRLALHDFIAVGTKIKMSEKRCREIFDEVYQNCEDLLLNKTIAK